MDLIHLLADPRLAGGFPDRVHAFAAFLQDLIDAPGLLGREPEVVLHRAKGGEPLVRGRRGPAGLIGLAGVLALRGDAEAERPGDHAGGEDQDGGENDGPAFHGLGSAESRPAMRNSSSCRPRSRLGELSITATLAAAMIMTAQHGARARQSSRPHKAQASCARAAMGSARRAMTRLSKPNGTCA